MKKFICTALACLLCASVSVGFSGCSSKSSSQPGYVVPATEPDLKNEDFSGALGDETASAMNMQEFCNSVKAMPIEEKEIVFLRSMRMKKETFLYDMECALKEKGISARFSELKILVRR